MLFEIYETESNGQAYKIERDIIELAERVFCRHDFTLQALKTAWLSRWKDPLEADYQLGRNGVSGDILTAWHHAETYQKAREQQPVGRIFYLYTSTKKYRINYCKWYVKSISL